MKEYIAAAMRVVREVEGEEAFLADDSSRGEDSPATGDDTPVILRPAASKLV
jgi:hypothetical protein